MTISGDGGQRVTAPECRPAMYGLLSVAEVDNRGEDTWARGLEWDQLDCAYDPGVITPCPPLPEQRKTTSRGFDTLYADAFAVVAGWTCSTPMAAGDSAPWDNAETLLDKNWGRTVESVFWTGVDQDGNSVRETLATSAPIDLTPAGGALDVTAGVAVLESFFGDCTDCEPIIHASRGLATFMAERGLFFNDERDLRMMGTGTRASVGGGYKTSGPGGVAAAVGEAWMFITGGVRITTGPKFFTPDRGDIGGAVNRSINDVTVYAERFAAVQIGCCVGAVRVTLNSCCCG